MVVATRAAAALGPLSRLPAAALDRLLEGQIAVQLPAGGVLYRPGEQAGLHLVVEGLIRISLASEEGRQVTIRYGRRGDVLGVPIAVFGSGPVHAQAVTDSVVVATRPGVLLQLAQRDPRVGLWMADELAARVQGLLQELSMNAFWPVNRRLARHLLDLAADQQRGQVLLVRASQQELANHVGTVREVVSRTLIGFRAAGYIDSSAGGILLLDPHALVHLGG